MPETTIARVRCRRVGIPYQKPFVIAGGPSEIADHVLVVLESPAGVTGVGEGAPMISYSDETPEDCLAAIENRLAGVVRGIDALDLAAIHAAMDAALPGHSFA
ncbi:MAG TPA: dipeptide epimerase, partial [Limnochordia bacterium]